MRNFSLIWECLTGGVKLPLPNRNRVKWSYLFDACIKSQRPYLLLKNWNWNLIAPWSKISRLWRHYIRHGITTSDVISTVEFPTAPFQMRFTQWRREGTSNLTTVYFSAKYWTFVKSVWFLSSSIAEQKCRFSVNVPFLCFFWQNVWSADI